MGFLRKFVQAAANEIDKVAAELHNGGQRNQQGQYGPQGGYGQPQQQYQGSQYGHHYGYQTHSPSPNMNQWHGSYHEPTQASSQPHHQPMYSPPPSYGQHAQYSYQYGQEPPHYQSSPQPAQILHLQQTLPAQSLNQEPYVRHADQEHHVPQTPQDQPDHGSHQNQSPQSPSLIEQQRPGQYAEQHSEQHAGPGLDNHAVQHADRSIGQSPHLEQPHHAESQEQHTSHTPAQEQPTVSNATRFTPPVEHYTPVPSKEPLVQVTEVPAPAPTCSPHENITEGHCTSLAPDVDICQSCFAKHVEQTPFAPYFRLITYPATAPKMCSLTYSSIRNRWMDITSRIAPDATADEKKMWLERFSTQHDELNAQIEQLINQISVDQREIQIMQIQQNYTQQSAMIQITSGHSAMIWGGSTIGSSLGQNRLAEAGRMSSDISARRVRLGELERQLNALAF